LLEARDQIADETARSRENRVVDVGVFGEDFQKGEDVVEVRRYYAQVDGRIVIAL